MNDQAASFSPFPGLRSFESHEAHLFFGREQQIDDLVRRLRTRRFLTILGTSGCGKSSLVKAGLLPSLHGGFMVTAGSAWRVATMRPGDAPIGSLARALNAPGVLGDHAPFDGGPLAPTDFTEISLRRGPLGLLDAARALWPSPGVNLLVVVDQFEETIRATLQGGRAQAEEAQGFVKLLLEATAQTELPIHVVLTMRSDFLGLCSRFRGLPEAINDGQYLVPALTREQLRSAIIGPAAVAGARVTTPVVQKLLEEVGDDQDRLPVLQHALMRTWALRSKADVMDLSDYSRTGGLASALSDHANEIYGQNLDDRGQEIARLLFQRLTEAGEPGQETRRWARISELCAVADASPQQVIAVVEAFRAPGCSFLMPPPTVPLTPETTLDISHESLIRQWNELKKWTEEERDSAEQYQRLSGDAELHARRRKGLWRSPELDIALRWKKDKRPTAAWAQRYAGDFTRAMTFLEKSRRVRVVWRSAGVAVAIVCVVIAVALIQRQANEVARRRIDARFDRVGRVNDPLTKALLLAELGLNPDSADRPRSHEQLYLSAATASIPRAVLGQANSVNAVVGVRFADDNRVITVDSRGSLREWSADGVGDPKRRNLSTAAVSREKADGTSLLQAVTFSGDQVWVAAVFQDGVYYGRIADGAPLQKIPVPEKLATNAPVSIALSHTGKRLAVGFDAYLLGLWLRREDGSVVFDRSLDLHQGPISALDFDRQESRLASSSWDGKLRVWSLETNQRLLKIGPDQPFGLPPTVSSVDFSPDGRWLVSGYGDGTTRVWLSDGTGQPLILQAHTDAVTSATFGPIATGSGKISRDVPLLVVTTSADRTARIWSLRRNPARPAELELIRSSLLAGHTSAVNTAVFSPDGTQLATASADGTALVWWTERQEPRLLGRHGDVIEAVRFSASGTRFVTASRDRTAWVWETTGSAAPLRLEHDDWVRGAVFNPRDDAQVATATYDQGLRILDLRTSQPRFRDLMVREDLSRDGSIKPMAVSWSRDGKWLGAALKDATARIWSLTAPGELISLDHARHPHHPDHPAGWVLDIDFSPDGTQVVTASADGHARLWKQDGELIQSLAVHPHTHPVTLGDDPRVVKAVFNPSGNRIATASGDVVRVWRLDGTQEPWEIRHRAAVNDVAYGRFDDNEWLVTASKDGTARVTDARSGLELFSLADGAPLTAAALDPARRQVMTGGEDGAIRLWRLDPLELVNYLRNATTACLAAADRMRVLEENEAEARRGFESCEQRNGRSPGL